MIEHKQSQDRRAKVDLEPSNIIAQVENSGFQMHSIPNEVQILMWNRENGRCAKCGSKEYIELDYIILVSKGGCNSALRYTAFM